MEKRVPGQIEVPQGSLDVRDFYRRIKVERRVEILRSNQVDYVMVNKDSPFVGWLERSPAFEPVDTPSEGYDLFTVDLGKLPK